MYYKTRKCNFGASIILPTDNLKRKYAGTSTRNLIELKNCELNKYKFTVLLHCLLCGRDTFQPV